MGTFGPDLGTLWLWDLATGAALLERVAHESEITCIHFDAVGDRLLTGATDGSLRIWDLATGSSLLDLVGHKHAIQSIGSSLADDRVVSCDGSGQVRFWPATVEDLVRLAPLRHGR